MLMLYSYSIWYSKCACDDQQELLYSIIYTDAVRRDGKCSNFGGNAE